MEDIVELYRTDILVEKKEVENPSTLWQSSHKALLEVDQWIQEKSMASEIACIQTLWKVDCFVDQQQQSNNNDDTFVDPYASFVSPPEIPKWEDGISSLWATDCTIHQASSHPLEEEANVMKALHLTDIWASHPPTMEEGHQQKQQADQISSLYQSDLTVERRNTTSHKNDDILWCDLYRTDLEVEAFQRNKQQGLGGKSDNDEAWKALWNNDQAVSHIRKKETGQKDAQIIQELHSTDCHVDKTQTKLPPQDWNDPMSNLKLLPNNYQLQSTNLSMVMPLLQVDHQVDSRSKQLHHHDCISSEIQDLYNVDCSIHSQKLQNHESNTAQSTLHSVDQWADQRQTQQHNLEKDIQLTQQLWKVDMEIAAMEITSENHCTDETQSALQDLWNVDCTVDKRPTNHKTVTFHDAYQLLSSTLDYSSDLSLRTNLELYRVDQEIDNLQNSLTTEKKKALLSEITALLEVDTLVSSKKQEDKKHTTNDSKPSQDLYYPPPDGTTKKRSIFSHREKNQASLKDVNTNVVMIGATMVVPTSNGVNEDDNIAMVQSIHYENEINNTYTENIPVDTKPEKSEQTTEESQKKKKFLFF